MKIAVAGTGYVGLSIATLLSQKYDVVAYSRTQAKIDMINNKISPIKDEYIEKYLKAKKLKLFATTDYNEAIREADYVVIATPTNYDDEINKFDTSAVEDVIEKVLRINPNATMIIKSTIPVGYTDSIKKKYSINNIIFSPEFLRESKALYDNLYPSRIIMGEESDRAKIFAEMLKECSLKKDVEIKYMSNIDAEAVKLFANTYLALRVAYFNELDTYAELKGLNTKNVIDGVCLDPRIGNHYNNPSFGYGGYCLPKDTKQLLANYKNVPENLIEAIVKSNETRKCHIANMTLKNNPHAVGIFRLTMKSESDNFRSSAIQGVIENLKKHNVKIYIYEKTLKDKTFNDCEVIYDLSKFKKECDVILANRIEKDIEDVKEKIYTRDLYFRD